MSEVRPLNEQNRDNDRQNPNNKRRRRRRRRNNGNKQDNGNNGMQMQHSNQGGGEGGGRNRRRRRRRGGGGGEHGGGGHRRVRLDPFELFAAFHLGLAQNGRYRKQGIRDVARRFNCGQRDVQEGLSILSMDRNAMRQMRFDPQLAELDIKVAPEGIDRGEVAKQLYQEFLECGRNAGLFEDEPSYPPLPEETAEEEEADLEQHEEPVGDFDDQEPAEAEAEDDEFEEDE